MTSFQPSADHRSPTGKQLTRLLMAWGDGDQDAFREIIGLVCHDLRGMAAKYLGKEAKDHVLQPTALVHEFFLKVHDRRSVEWTNRAHFFGFAANTMRQILVDFARARRRAKRGGGQKLIALGPELDAIADLDVPNGPEILDLHRALVELEASDPRAARVVDLRYIVGMSVQETAAALDIAPATVKRDWQFAKLWLYRRLADT